MLKLELKFLVFTRFIKQIIFKIIKKAPLKK